LVSLKVKLAAAVLAVLLASSLPSSSAASDEDAGPEATVAIDTSPYSPEAVPAAQCSLILSLTRELSPSTDTSCVPHIETNIPDVGSCPSGQAGAVVNDHPYCVDGLGPGPCRQASDCVDYACDRVGGCELPDGPDVGKCDTGVGVVVDGRAYCVGSIGPCSDLNSCLDYVCSFTEDGCDVHLPTVQVCPLPKAGVIVGGSAHCASVPATPKLCTGGTIGVQPSCHTAQACDGGNVGLKVDGSSLFCLPVKPPNPCPDNSYGVPPSCHTVQPCSGDRAGYTVDGISTGCVSDPGVAPPGPPGEVPGVGSPCNLAGASRSCGTDTEPGFHVMRIAPPDAEDSQTLAAIAAAPKCRATPALRHHEGLGIDVEGLLLSCPDYSKLLSHTVAPPQVDPKVPSVPWPEHVKVDLIDEQREASAAASDETVDCSASPSTAPGKTRLWYTVYADDYFWKTHYGRNGEPDDAEEYVSNIHAFWTTRSDGRWQTHVTQPLAPTCPRWILPMPHGDVDAVRTDRDLARLRAYENGFSDKGQVVVAMGVGQIEYPDGWGGTADAFGYTIGGPVSDVGDLPPAVYFDGADSPWYADRLFTHEMGHAFGLRHSPCNENMAGHDGDPWVHIMAFSGGRHPTCKPTQDHWHWIFMGTDAMEVQSEYEAWCAAVGGADCA
jgi:hypothetical protein